MVFLKNALMCILKKEEKNVTLINHDCLPILMLLYIMLHAYLMLFAALSNSAYLHNASFLFSLSFLAIYFCKCFLFSCFVLFY